MKILSPLLFGMLILSPARAAITISGTLGTGFGNAPVNSLVLFIVDSGSNGFLGSSFSGDLLAGSDPSLSAQSNISIGGTFGGDTILGRASVTTVGTIPGGFTIDNTAPYQSKNFALVWFNGLTTSATSAGAGVTYGIFRGVDWIMPSTDSGTYTTSSLFANYDPSSTIYARVTVSSGVATNDVFTTSSGPVFSIVPETSTALLGAIGSLLLLRRRRNA